MKLVPSDRPVIVTVSVLATAVAMPIVAASVVNLAAILVAVALTDTPIRI